MTYKEALDLLCTTTCNAYCPDLRIEGKCDACREAYDMIEEICNKADKMKPIKDKGKYTCPLCKERLLVSDNEDYEYSITKRVIVICVDKP